MESKETLKTCKHHAHKGHCSLEKSVELVKKRACDGEGRLHNVPMELFDPGLAALEQLRDKPGGTIVAECAGKVIIRPVLKNLATLSGLTVEISLYGLKS